MILLIDNYDSFTFNLVQYLGELGQTCRVYRNDRIHLSLIGTIKPQYLLFHRVPARRGKPEFLRARSCRWPVGFPFWEYAWATSALARLSEGKSSGPSG